jgi:hypothetical protein
MSVAAATGGSLSYLSVRLESLAKEAETWGDITRLPDLDTDNQQDSAQFLADLRVDKYCPAHWQQRSWQERRLVLNCESLLFAKPGSNTVIDVIQLQDVMSIEFGTLSSFHREEAQRHLNLQQSSRAMVRYGVHMAAALVHYPLGAGDFQLWMRMKGADDAWSRSVRKRRGAEHALHTQACVALHMCTFTGEQLALHYTCVHTQERLERLRRSTRVYIHRSSSRRSTHVYRHKIAGAALHMCTYTAAPCAAPYRCTYTGAACAALHMCTSIY